MKVTILNGNTRHGSTWHCMDMLRQELAKSETLDVTEFSLPRDMPHFCNGCFNCIYHGEAKCPHADTVNPIIEALLAADLIILTSPIYALDISGQMKAMLDHLCFMWLTHRPNPAMFNKIGLTITTTAGAGLGHATKTLRNSLNFWGVKRIYSMKNVVAASKWSEVSAKKQAKIQKNTVAMAKRIIKVSRKIESLPTPIFQRFMFFMMTGMMKKNTWNLHDRSHWESHGWLTGSSPY